MFVYEKRLEYPINIKNPNPKLAAAIISQYGGPDCCALRKRGPGQTPGASPAVYCSFLFRRFVTIRPAIPDRDSAHRPARIMR